MTIQVRNKGSRKKQCQICAVLRDTSRRVCGGVLQLTHFLLLLLLLLFMSFLYFYI
jgi:hypothetical protein